jgi:molybdate transport system substrate-binding protein
MSRFAALALAVFLAGCARPAARPSEVVVFAAASLTDVLAELGGNFQRDHPGVRFVFNLASSSDLARQVVAGAHADLLICADSVAVAPAVAAGRVEVGFPRPLLTNALVCVVPANSGLRLASAADLVRPGVRRVAVADPEGVPAGRYARAFLERSGVWSALLPKLVPTLDVRAALAAVEVGSVDCGLVYRSDAAASGRVRVAFAAPPAAAPRIVYPAALLAGASPEARVFYASLRAPAARTVWERHGFGVLP